MTTAADGVSSELQTSASVAAGLINRHSGPPSVFMNLLPADKLWIASLQNEEASMQNCTWTNITVPALWQLAHDTGQHAIAVNALVSLRVSRL